MAMGLLITIVLSVCAFVASSEKSTDRFSVMFYNVENLFDVTDDSLKNDNEFLPEGSYHWTYNRMKEKISRVYKVIVAAAEGHLPAIIGLCEIENRFVLEQLIYHTPLLKMEYKIVHHESPDRRGIDVALLYRPDLFKVIDDKAIPVTLPDNPAFVTRDILYVKGLANRTDTLHVFVNHWPSRYGGQAQSEPKRIAAAKTLNRAVDSIHHVNPKSKIVITGDFNDNPFDRSIQVGLMNGSVRGSGPGAILINLSEKQCRSHTTGTLKYRGEWACFDQFIISEALINDCTGLCADEDSYSIFAPDFLSEEDQYYSGKRPFRTYLGRRYHGGFSDHYPVMLDLKTD